MTIHRCSVWKSASKYARGISLRRSICVIGGNAIGLALESRGALDLQRFTIVVLHTASRCTTRSTKRFEIEFRVLISDDIQEVRVERVAVS